MGHTHRHISHASTLPRKTFASFASFVVQSLLLSPALAAGPVLFDAHLHYNADHREALPPARVVEILEGNGVAGAVVTGSPPETVLALHDRAPGTVVPLLGVYREPGDKQDWHQDPGLAARVKAMLDEGPWRGIGELHLFAPHRHSPVLAALVDLAADRGLVLQMHCDPAVIDTIFEQRPDVTVLWAHAGRYPYPPLLRDYLGRHPTLYADLSMRDERLVKGGTLDPGWELLLLEFPDRFMVGVDTFSTGRWQDFADHVSQTRAWLALLPEDIARAIACTNAARLFQLPVCGRGVQEKQ